MTIEFSYLRHQFRDEEAEAIWRKIKPVVTEGRFTLGVEVDRFEEAYAAKAGSKYAVGVNSGTEALALPLMALGVTGEVICPAFSFIATAGAIAQAGAIPVFADVGEDMNIDVDRIEEKITPRTEFIMPVWWGGRPPKMHKIMEIADRHGLGVLCDAAQALGSSWMNKGAGAWGAAAGYSLHPLKVCNSWFDSGLVCTNDESLAIRLKRLRNHGLVGRDTWLDFGVNGRIDTIAAVVAHYVLDRVDGALAAREAISQRLFRGLSGIDGITLVSPPIEAICNWYLLTGLAKSRDKLLAYLNGLGIEAKSHYPVSLPSQPACAKLGHSSLDPAHRLYQKSDFPGAERAASETISLPNHEYLTMNDVDAMIAAVAAFYGQQSSVAAE